MLMLLFHKKIFFFYHFLKLKFICQLGQTQIHIVISFFYMIRDHKLIPHLRINDIDALVSWEKLLFPSFFGLKILLLIKMNMDLHSNLLSFHDWAPLTILLVRINDIDALVSYEKPFYRTFSIVKVYLSIRTNTDSHGILLSFHD